MEKRKVDNAKAEKQADDDCCGRSQSPTKQQIGPVRLYSIALEASAPELYGFA